MKFEPYVPIAMPMKVEDFPRDGLLRVVFHDGVSREGIKLGDYGNFTEVGDLLCWAGTVQFRAGCDTAWVGLLYEKDGLAWAWNKIDAIQMKAGQVGEISALTMRVSDLFRQN